MTNEEIERFADQAWEIIESIVQKRLATALGLDKRMRAIESGQTSAQLAEIEKRLDRLEKGQQ